MERERAEAAYSAGRARAVDLEAEAEKTVVAPLGATALAAGADWARAMAEEMAVVLLSW